MENGFRSEIQCGSITESQACFIIITIIIIYVCRPTAYILDGFLIFRALRLTSRGISVILSPSAHWVQKSFFFFVIYLPASRRNAN